jgi:hypothetical protein
MKGTQENKLKYSIMTDPHMYYYLQSPHKVADLLKSGLYSIKGNTLIEKASKLTFKLEEYVVEKVKVDQPELTPSRKELSEIINSEKFRAF